MASHDISQSAMGMSGHACFSIFTYGSLDLIRDRRAAFPSVLVGNQIAEYSRRLTAISKLLWAHLSPRSASVAAR
jgi:hypothetical protein